MAHIANQTGPKYNQKNIDGILENVDKKAFADNVEIHVVLPDMTEKSTGWVMLWHTTPGKQNTPPIFIGELKFKIANTQGAAVSKTTYPNTVKDKEALVKASKDAMQTSGNAMKNEYQTLAKIEVPYIMIQQTYQKQRLAPALWTGAAHAATINGQNQFNKWNKTAAGEPPLDVIMTTMPDPELRKYWDKVGFNFFATQNVNAWDFPDDNPSDAGTDKSIRAKITSVWDGKASQETKSEVNALLSIAPSGIQGPTRYIASIAEVGLQRGGWRLVASPKKAAP